MSVIEDTVKNLERRVANIELGTTAAVAADGERELTAFKLQLLGKLKVIRYRLFSLTHTKLSSTVIALIILDLA